MALGANANLVNIIIRARDQTRAAFASAKTGITSTKAATRGLSKNLGGLNKSFSAISGKVSGFGTKLKGLMTSAIGPLIGVMGIAAVTMALKKSVNAFGSFEQAAANASSVTGKTGAAFLETKKHIMDVSKVLGETTVFKASEAADAFYDLASAGYDVANITKTELKPILDLAAASQTDLKATTELVTSTLGQFGMAIGDSKKVADIFARTIGSSKATMEKLGNSMVYVGPVAHALGRSLEETSATLGVLYNKGFDASMAGTALRGALSRLMNPSAEVNAKLSELGVTVAEVNPETHSMADILDTLTAAGMGTADAMKLFGLRAGPAMLALTNNTDDIRELTASLGEAGGAAETMASQQLTTFEGQMKLVKSKIEAFMLSIGEMTAPAVLAMANALTDHLLPALETLYTTISTGFGEAFESISRQVGPALAPLSEKLKEASDKISGGFDFKTLADDVGVFIGAALKPLLDYIGWLIDKLGPLFDLYGKGAGLIHNFANALKTEEGKLDDICDATEKVSAAKRTLFAINEKLRDATKTLADEIRNAGGWTESLSSLEADAKSKTDALAEARKAATTAIAEHGASSEIARAAIDKVKIAEEEAKDTTESYQSVLDTSAQKFIDAGVATEGLQEAHVNLETASNNSLTAQENLQAAISDLAKEIEEAKQAPFNLGEAFSDFSTKVKAIFLELPLQIVEAFGKINTIIADIFSDLGAKISEFSDKLPDFFGVAAAAGVGESFNAISDDFNNTADNIEARVKEVRDSFEENLEDPLKKDVTEAADTAADAVDDAMSTIVEGAENAGDTIDELTDKTETLGEETVAAGDAAEEAYDGIALQVGDTEISIEKLRGELGDNVNAFENLKEAASKLMDLDWSVFTEFEAALPNIEAGIGDMESSFVGLNGILEENIDELENVKHAVIDISEIAAPFLEKGFLDGIKSIGEFAGALSDAGGAINTFAGLQDVSIEGCINFSMHVYDMVSALEILESQMDDMVPSFGRMGELSMSLAKSYLGGESFIEETTKQLGFFGDKLEAIQKQGSKWDLSASGIFSYKQIRALMKAMGATDAQASELIETIGPALRQEIIRLGRASGDSADFVDKLSKSTLIMNIGMDLSTSKLKSQNEQLSKITDALQPYLEFMRTLNELAALSTLSTDELNNGLNAINDTLINLGTSLSTFDLRPVMESLFGTKTGAGEFTGGVTKGFTDTMQDYQGEFEMLIGYISRLSFAIDSLVFSFDALENVSESVLADGTKLKDLFGELVRIMVNFSEGLGEEGFAETIATSMELMLKSAAPLISYFQHNNTEVKLFNSTLTTFTTTIKNVVDTMGMLKGMSEMVLPSVDDLAAGFDKAAEFVRTFDEALMMHVGAREGQWDMDKYFNSVFSNITNFADSWDMLTIDMEDSFETFDKGTATIITLISSITSLVDAFQTLADMPLITSDQIVAGFEKIKDTIEEVNKCMKQFAAEGLSELVASLKSVAKMWIDWDTKIGESDDTFGDAVTGITALVTAISDLVDVQKRLVELEGVSDTEWLSFFDKIAEQVDQINKGMLKFGVEGVNALTNDLAGMEAQWALLASQMGTSLTSFDDASSGIGGLANSVSGLVGAFTALAEMPVMTADAFSASMKDMSKNIENFASALKDNIATIEKALEAVDEAWSDYAANMATLVPIFKDATDAINTLAGGIMSVVRSFESLKDVNFEEVFTAGFENLTNATGEFATALKNNIDGLLTSLNALVNAWLENENETVKLMRAFIIISSNFMIVISYANALQSAFSSMDAESDTLGKGFKELTEFMNDVIEGVQEIYTADVAADLAQFVIDVGHVIDALAKLETAINTAMGLIHTKIETTVNDAKNKVFELSSIPGNAYTWGADIIYSFVNGMKAMEFYLIAELQRLGMLIAFYLAVGSNTKLGALSHLTDWPKNLVKTFADGIKNGTPEISKALSSLTLPVENLHIPGGYAGVLGGGGNTVTMYNTWNVGNQHDADYAIGEIETMLTRKKVL